jgi:hypothetical protein
MSKQVTFEGVSVTPSQLKTLAALKEQILVHHGEGYEYKRFEVFPFSSARIVEVLIEVGKTDESPAEYIWDRTVRQIFVGERGGCELINSADREKSGKIKGLRECVISPTIG